MKIYIDLVIIINFFFDFLLLFSVSKLLKRSTNLKRLFLSSFIGTLSIIFLFTKFTKLELILYKNLIAILMCITAFDFKNIKYTIKNIIYLYFTSIILLGIINLLNIENIIIINKKIKTLLIMIISPLVVYIYIKINEELKNNYSLYHIVDIYFRNNKNISLTGYYDTGNNLIDPYKNRLIILVTYSKIKQYITNENKLYVPYKKLNTDDILECIRVKKIKIKDKEYNNILIGLSYEELCIDGVDCILNNKMEELC